MLSLFITSCAAVSTGVAARVAWSRLVDRRHAASAEPTPAAADEGAGPLTWWLERVTVTVELINVAHPLKVTASNDPELVGALAVLVEGLAALPVAHADVVVDIAEACAPVTSVAVESALAGTLDAPVDVIGAWVGSGLAGAAEPLLRSLLASEAISAEDVDQCFRAGMRIAVARQVSFGDVSEAVEDLVDSLQTLVGDTPRAPLPVVTCTACLDDLEEHTPRIHPALGGECDHALCVECAMQYMRTAESVPVPCSVPDCGSFFSRKQLLGLLSHDTGSQAAVERYIHQEIKTLLDMMECPACHNLVELPPAVVRHRRAGTRAPEAVPLATDCPNPECGASLCVVCQSLYHPNKTCAAFQEEEQYDEDDHKLLRVATSNGWRRCPSCRSVVERTAGCSHMKCRCSATFCYECGGPLTHPPRGRPGYPMCRRCER